MLNKVVLDSQFDQDCKNDHVNINAETNISDIVKDFIEQDQAEVRFASC